MARLSTFVLRHKRLVVLFWLALAVAGMVASPKLSTRLSQQFSLPGQKSYEANQAILRTYGNGGNTLPLVGIVSAPPGTTLDSPAARQVLARAFAQAAQTQAVAQPGASPAGRVVSYASTGDQRLLSADRRSGYGLVYPPTRASQMNAPDLVTPVASALRQGLPAGWSVQVTGLSESQSGGDSNCPGVLRSEEHTSELQST